MDLSERERELIEAIASIGKKNISMKEIASSLGISYKHFINQRMYIAHKNGYHSFAGFLCDYVREQEIGE